jgi:sugar phosphate isomerase/epimerase
MRIGLFTDALPDRPLTEVMDWLRDAAPQVSRIEIGTGGYSPARHIDRRSLLQDPGARERWVADIHERGFELSALNVSGNPLHPDADVARQHDLALRETIQLAALLGVDRVVAMSGCPGAGPGDRTAPHFAAGGWLPDLEHVAERQWDEHVRPYWTELAAFAAREHPDLLICFELHPGTYVYNSATFAMAREIAPNLGVNLDPSHFFWQGMDALAVVRAVGDRIGHSHGKDTLEIEANKALNGMLDSRWPGVPAEMPWNFATVGRGRDVAWWTDFVRTLASKGFDGTISIEFEDPFVPVEDSIVEAARVLAQAMTAAGVYGGDRLTAGATA